MQTSVLLIQVLRVSHDAIKPTGDNSALPHDRVDQAGRPTSNAQDWEHALCERLLTLAGASLSNMQELGATSTIELRWPAPLCEAPQAPGFAPTAPESKPWRFLLVDDQPKRLLELQSMVRRHWPGAVLGQSDSGESALLQLEFTPYDMVLIALHLQGMDGLETVRRMRQHAKAQLHDVPVIGLCDKAFAHQRQRYLAAGMQWLLFWPLQEAQLARLMRLHLPEDVL
jgi:CheY-like chemotaxis protein